VPEPVHPQLAPAWHGGPGRSAFAGLDFSVNANVYGPNPLLLSAVQHADHAHYPDSAYLTVRERLGAWHGVDAGCVVPAVGASELLHRLARAYLRPGDRVLSVLAPFGEFGRAAALERATVETVRPEQAGNAVQNGVKLVYLGHPHNPTGTVLAGDHLAALQHSCEQAGALLIVDLAYAPFLRWPDPPLTAHTVLLHSPGKAHGLVGARPAYALAAPGVAAALNNLAPAWALPAGTAALLAALPDAQGFLTDSLPEVARNAAQLGQALAVHGEVERHGTPFMTLRVEDAAGMCAALLGRGFRVRDCASYGLPEQLRISARLPEENARLVQVIRGLLTGGHR
jgi:histidinol-phosphate aminotransferase